ncbi:hypothetical protein EXIGLDRAFT_762419 [Exidia glandulosa HHB12029]|uniref:PhoD-like phosphatase metallophosphatase domain-containing protein n=1 Tax=Exidia glandulosa HHB12029 TaxID=1314781 RepID=A0A165MUB2_EXIGL|nr:hypothetical protein EXIGLDRAFT_762419 [Exidia glandulosa HHB12029]
MRSSSAKMLQIFGGLVLLVASASASANPYKRNVAYHSPFEAQPHLGFDLDTIDTRTARTERLFKRQTVDASPFNDEHYVLYGGADFTTAPFIWSGGVNFTHNVASGDPFSSSVLLWTRAAPVTGTAHPDQSVPICVSFSVWDNEALTGEPVDSGDAFTSWDVDFTVKVEASGLTPDTWYWYWFADCTNASTTSPLGRTRTFASPNTPAAQVNGGVPLKLAVFSCSNFPFGFFNAYRVARENVSADAFVHLGDYMYENKDSSTGHAIGRILSDRELATITDYRTRLALYRTDSALVSAHASAPWITVWDDHEVANNGWKAGTSDSNDSVATGGCAFSPSLTCFTDRKNAAVRAYHEWMPIRQVAADDKLRIWRNFRIGKLLDLTMLDTRNYDRDVTDDGWNRALVATLADQPQRSIMGLNQEQWFFDRLTKSKQRGAVWRIVGQQVVFSSLLMGTSFNLDAWDGYKQNRQRILEHIHDNAIDNVVILAGDSHANWVSDLSFPNDTTTYNFATGEGALGVEFAGTAVTSSSSFGSNIAPAAANVKSAALLAANPELQWSEGSFRGFFVLSVGADSLNATYYAMNNIRIESADGFASANFTVLPGENRLHRPVAGGTVAAGVLQNATST